MKRPIFLACLLLSGLPCPPAAGQEFSNSGYSIKPSEVSVPQGAELGRYHRTIQPFENWELRCDENLKRRRKFAISPRQFSTARAGSLSPGRWRPRRAANR